MQITSDIHLAHPNALDFERALRSSLFPPEFDTQAFYAEIDHLAVEIKSNPSPSTQAGALQRRKQLLAEATDIWNDAAVSAWNRLVHKKAEVWILGDLALGNPGPVKSLLERMNGTLFLVQGNHDYSWLNADTSSRFERIENYAELKWNRKHIVLMHYPISSWNRRGHGSVHLHGHCHSKPSGINCNRDGSPAKAFNVGYPATSRMVSHLDDILLAIEQKHQAWEAAGCPPAPNPCILGAD